MNSPKPTAVSSDSLDINRASEDARIALWTELRTKSADATATPRLNQALLETILRALQEPDDQARLLEVWKGTEENADARLCLLLLILNPKGPLIWKGAEVSEGWLQQNPTEAKALIESEVPNWESTVGRSPFLTTYRTRWRTVTNAIENFVQPRASNTPVASAQEILERVALAQVRFNHDKAFRLVLTCQDAVLQEANEASLNSKNRQLVEKWNSLPPQLRATLILSIEQPRIAGGRKEDTSDVTAKKLRDALASAHSDTELEEIDAAFKSWNQTDPQNAGPERSDLEQRIEARRKGVHRSIRSTRLLHWACATFAFILLGYLLARNLTSLDILLTNGGEPIESHRVRFLADGVDVEDHAKLPPWATVITVASEQYDPLEIPIPPLKLGARNVIGPIELKRSEGLVKLNVKPRTAEVVISGSAFLKEVKANEPAFSLPTGKYTAHAKSGIWSSALKEFSVKRGETTWVTFAFDGHLEVRAPPEASIFVNGEYVGKAFYRTTEAATGDATVRVTRENYRPFEKSVTLKAGTPITVNALLDLAPRSGVNVNYVMLDGSSSYAATPTAANKASQGSKSVSLPAGSHSARFPAQWLRDGRLIVSSDGQITIRNYIRDRWGQERVEDMKAPYVSDQAYDVSFESNKPLTILVR